MAILKNRYNSLKPLYTKETRNEDIKLLLDVKTKIPVDKSYNTSKLDGYGWYNMKPQMLTHEDEREVYKIINRDVLTNGGLKKVEVGDIFHVGRFVKQKKR
ncbi:hypothetical protein COBT_001585 [Conglomerata obtusa]